jgi:Fic/DOC family N-terminal
LKAPHERQHQRFASAKREIEVLGDAVKAASDYANLLNRREAVDSSQIEGTHTQFDELLLHELEVGTPDAVADSDAERTLNYLRAYTLGVTQVRRKGRRALDGRLIRVQWSPWVELFLECTLASCRHTVHLLRELQAISDRWRECLMARRTRKYALVWRVADLLLGQPVVTVNALVERLKVTFPSANAAAPVLVEMDMLRPQGKQRRNRAFHAHEVMNILYSGIDAVLEDMATLRNYRGGG